ncbi:MULTISPECIES: thioredoxin family protein [Rhodopseudomonas]|nr:MULTISPECIES: thioredoxin family protein [Rhodopseudomonas]MDF3810809.1 thioredoxin family protein [Rhodopseudomonas sp. BAL398]WOK17330.1 thioredoxin family protein [Rhodopseudomonas sp. BAL398]
MYHIMARTLLKSSLFGLFVLIAAVLAPAVSQSAELLMYERAGCVWCARWDRDVGPIYGKTDEAKMLPLRRINIDQPAGAGVELTAPVHFTPTFVVSDHGREVGRITGYINDDAFWGLLGVLLKKIEPRPVPSPS